MLTSEQIAAIKERCEKADLDWYIEDIHVLIEALEGKEELLSAMEELAKALANKLAEWETGRDRLKADLEDEKIEHQRTAEYEKFHKARAEALERAIKWGCPMDTICEICAEPCTGDDLSCIGGSRWQFDAARFGGTDHIADVSKTINPMKRLTMRNSDGEVFCTRNCGTTKEGCYICDIIIERLADYEEIDLTPIEIMYKLCNAKLRRWEPGEEMPDGLYVRVWNNEALRQGAVHYLVEIKNGVCFSYQNGYEVGCLHVNAVHYGPLPEPELRLSPESLRTSPTESSA